MRFLSTGGQAPAVNLEEALFAGPAPDGGLYVPETLPRIQPPAAGASFTDTALSVARALFEEDVPREALEEIVRDGLDFEIPLVPVEEGVYSLELFHGPTLAFKDVGARFMARLLLHFLRRRGRDVTVLVATSGDTGSAVASAFYRLEGTRVVVLFPRGKVSALQQKLFTTLGGNVSALGVEGTFDDCQRMVKQAFADRDIPAIRSLVSANSINVGRLLPQTFYYFHISSRIEGGAPLLVATPSGNFGNLTAGLIAKRMGFRADKFVAATNVNDVVPEYLAGGTYRPRPSVATLSNAMDVGDPSNWARIQWLYRGSLEEIRRDLLGSAHTDEETLGAMRDLYRRTGYVLDPHSAVAYLGALHGMTTQRNRPTALFLSTAHPAKFQETVERAIESKIELPPALAQALDRPERFLPIPAEYGALKEYLSP
ncbi:MAG TPA: threonine synthase [Vicinamibacteria bacterium]|nr:threonine synthase [Vicinamibacteria bacterium]